MARGAWKHAGAWLLLALCGALGVGSGLLAGVRLPAVWAVPIGGAVSACAVLVGGRAQTWLDGVGARRERVSAASALSGGAGALPRVADVRDAVRLGVHPARVAEAGAARGTSPGPAGGLPPYVPRALDGDVRDALVRERFVLIVGESTAGKSRAAFEAMRAVLPAHLLAAPVDRAALSPLVEHLREHREPVVVWLDDLERFLGPGGLSPALLDELTAREGTVVLGTIRARELGRLGPRATTDPDSDEGAASRAVRRVLANARTIPLDRVWTPGELAAAEAFTDDARIAQALGRVGAFGLAEVLTAGPELLRDWRAAWEPGTHPRAAALVAAAVDCRRIGLDEPVGRHLLEALHRHYLTERGGHALRPEPLEEAWAWALQPVHGASSLIVPLGGDDEEPEYLAFDYLVDQPGLPPVPAETWAAALAHASEEQRAVITDRSYAHHRRTFHRAVDSGLVTNVFSRASALADKERYGEAIALLTRELGDQAAEPGGRGVSVRHQIAFYTMRDGRYAEAETAFGALLAEQRALPDADEEWSHVIRHNLASCARRRGDRTGALAQFRGLLADRERLLGPTALNTLDTRRRIAELVADLGDPAEALRQAREVYEAEEAHLGPDHVNTLETRCRIADFLARTGDPAAALDALDACLPDLARTSGEEHPDVLAARQRRAEYAAACGRWAEALSDLEGVVSVQERTRGADHPAAGRAREALDELRARRPV
ncbi:tetratricopeptide repeat protein [Streptomyces sp. NPDC001941]|uniref:tetratricopeptide repeat protein n=1 Tax=Streptomyces sp. NPDC001941 TaxID=3154659 RepID=UPI003330A98E